MGLTPFAAVITDDPFGMIQHRLVDAGATEVPFTLPNLNRVQK